MKQTVARYCAIAAGSASGEAFSSSTVEAPTDSGNSSSPPRPKVKASGGLPMKTSSARRPQHVLRPAGAGRHHVAVEVHRALGLAGGARGEGDEAGVVAARSSRCRTWPAWPPRAPRARPASGVLKCSTCVSVGQPGRASASSSASRASHSAWLTCALRDDLRQLLGAQQRHAAHRDAAGLDHGEPAGREHRRVGAAQQHAVAGHQAQVLDQHAGDAVGLRLQFGIGPAHAVALHAQAIALPARDPAVEQLARAVELLGELQVGRSNRNSGHCSRGGRWSAAKVSTCAVAMSAPPSAGRLPMISCCTSVAPS